VRLKSFCAAAVLALAAVGCEDSSDPINGSTPEPPLAGTTWRLLSIEGHDAIDGVRVTASFGEQSIAGSAGCNSYFGSAQAEGAQLKVGVLATTKKQCEDAVMPQEQAYLAALAAASVYRIVGAELHVGPDANVTTLVFRYE
jgi:heat shock protein HslJ